MPRSRIKVVPTSPATPPARSIEARENQLIGLAVDLAERQLKNGTASAQVITHFLKLGSTLAELEKTKLEQENLLLVARQQAIKSSGQVEELYSAALKAMKRYNGESSEDVE